MGYVNTEVLQGHIVGGVNFDFPPPGLLDRFRVWINAKAETLFGAIVIGAISASVSFGLAYYCTIAFMSIMHPIMAAVCGFFVAWWLATSLFTILNAWLAI